MQYHCYNCPYNTSRIQLINTHQKTHRLEINKKYLCFECDIEFSKYGAFCVHLSKKHRFPLLRKDIPKVSMKCENCQYMAPNVTIFLSHVRQHLKKHEKIICVCEKPFEKVTTFNSHWQKNHFHLVLNQEKGKIDLNNSVSVEAHPIELGNELASNNLSDSKIMSFQLNKSIQTGNKIESMLIIFGFDFMNLCKATKKRSPNFRETWIISFILKLIIVMLCISLQKQSLMLYIM